jgi:uncharacterized protein (TIGR02996 family)
MPNWVVMGFGCGPCAVSYNVGSQGIGARKPELVIFGRNNYCSFLQSILSGPLDDTNRLVFADWLEEHDEPRRACYQRLEVAKRDVLREPQSDEARLRYAGICEAHGEVERAEFIRVQLQIAELEKPGSTADPKRYLTAGMKYRSPPDFDRLMNLRLVSRKFLCKNWTFWIPWQSPTHSFTLIMSPRWSDDGTPACDFRRGFVHSITLSAAQAEMYLDEVLEEQPIECVTLTSRPESPRIIRISQMMPYYAEMEFCGRVIRVSEELMVESRQPQGGVDVNRIMPHALHARWPSVPIEGWKLPPVNAFDAGSTAFRRLREQLVAIPPQVIREIMGLDRPLSPDEPLTPR